MTETKINKKKKRKEKKNLFRIVFVFFIKKTMLLMVNFLALISVTTAYKIWMEPIYTPDEFLFKIIRRLKNDVRAREKFDYFITNLHIEKEGCRFAFDVKGGSKNPYFNEKLPKILSHYSPKDFKTDYNKRFYLSIGSEDKSMKMMRQRFGKKVTKFLKMKFPKCKRFYYVY